MLKHIKSYQDQNFIGGEEYPTLYTAAKHTEISYDAIRYWYIRW